MQILSLLFSNLNRSNGNLTQIYIVNVSIFWIEIKIGGNFILTYMWILFLIEKIIHIDLLLETKLWTKEDKVWWQRTTQEIKFGYSFAPRKRRG